MYLSAQSVAPYKSPFTSNPIHPAIFLPVFRAAVQNRASEELPAMAASASGVGALSSALSALHLTRTSTSRFTRKFRSLSPRVRSSSTFLSSSSLSYTGKLTRPRPETDDRKALSSADDDGFTLSQLDLPWIGGADGKVSSAQQSRTAERFLQSLVDATPRRKKKSSSLSKVDTGQRAVSEPPKYSKAARRFFNERFREPPQRLSKVLAASGVAARRSCEELIFDGRVTVNGSVCNSPQTRVDPARDIIYVNGRRLPKKLPPKVYLALNKPKGYICSCGEKESKSVLCLFDDFLKSWDKRNPGQRKPRLFTVGRLDVATTGLILITNDGEFAQKVSHPSSNLTKEYIAAIDGAVHKRQLVTISKGTVIDGVHCIPDFVELLPDQPDVRRTRIRIVVHEGRNHEVRELVKNAGLQIHSLKRTRIGGFRLPNDLRLGKHIELKQNDLKALGWKS